MLRRFAPVLATLVAVPLLLTACASEAGPSLDGKKFVDRTGREQVTIEAIDNSFTPQYVEISPGTTVTFANEGRNRHNVIAIDETFEDVDIEEFNPGDSAERTFEDPGDYPYYCSLHGTPTSGMIGGIRVVEE